MSSKAKLDLTYLSPIGSSNEEQINADVKLRAESGDGEGTKSQEKRSDRVFDQLVLPPGHKEMVLSLIAQHFRDKESAMADKEQIDIVRGKGKKYRHLDECTPLCKRRHANNLSGKGLIILLHGLPGVGKTTTAGISYLHNLFCPTNC